MLDCFYLGWWNHSFVFLNDGCIFWRWGTFQSSCIFIFWRGWWLLHIFRYSYYLDYYPFDYIIVGNLSISLEIHRFIRSISFLSFNKAWAYLTFEVCSDWVLFSSFYRICLWIDISTWFIPFSFPAFSSRRFFCLGILSFVGCRLFIGLFFIFIGFWVWPMSLLFVIFLIFWLIFRFWVIFGWFRRGSSFGICFCNSLGSFLYRSIYLRSLWNHSCSYVCVLFLLVFIFRRLLGFGCCFFLFLSRIQVFLIGFFWQESRFHSLFLLIFWILRQCWKHFICCFPCVDWSSICSFSFDFDFDFGSHLQFLFWIQFNFWKWHLYS